MLGQGVRGGLLEGVTGRLFVFVRMKYDFMTGLGGMGVIIA